MKYTVHIESMEIDQEEKEHLLSVGFNQWFFEQAELKNINHDYIEINGEQ